MKLLSIVLLATAVTTQAGGPSAAIRGARSVTKATIRLFGPQTDGWQQKYLVDTAREGREYLDDIAVMLGIKPDATKREIVGVLERLDIRAEDEVLRDRVTAFLHDDEGIGADGMFDRLSDLGRLAYRYYTPSRRYDAPAFLPVPTSKTGGGELLGFHMMAWWRYNHLTNYAGTSPHKRLHNILTQIPKDRGSLEDILTDYLPLNGFAAPTPRSMYRLSNEKLATWVFMIKTAEHHASRTKNWEISRQTLALMASGGNDDFFAPENDNSFFLLVLDEWAGVGFVRDGVYDGPEDDRHWRDIFSQAIIYRETHPDATVMEAMLAVADDANGSGLRGFVHDVVEAD